MQEVHRVDIFQDYASQSIVVHFLIWDPGGGVHYFSYFEGFYCVSHRWTWDPGILVEWIWLLLEDKHISSREDCNDPTMPLKYPCTHYNIHLATLVIINLCTVMMSQSGDITETPASDALLSTLKLNGKLE